MGIRLTRISDFVKAKGFDIDIVLTPTIKDRIAVTDGKILALNANILKEEKSIILAITHELPHIKDKSSEHNETFRNEWIELTLELAHVLQYNWTKETVLDEIAKIELLFENTNRLDPNEHFNN
jgi:hypothetical protein